MKQTPAQLIEQFRIRLHKALSSYNEPNKFNLENLYKRISNFVESEAHKKDAETEHAINFYNYLIDEKNRRFTGFHEKEIIFPQILKIHFGSRYVDTLYNIILEEIINVAQGDSYWTDIMEDILIVSTPFYFKFIDTLER